MDGFGDEPPAAAAKPKDGTTGDGVDYAGTQLTVTWGKEHIQPIRFQGMDIGPYTMQIVVHQGESPIEAKRRAMQHLNVMAEEELAEKLPRFIQRCKDAADDL